MNVLLLLTTLCWKVSLLRHHREPTCFLAKLKLRGEKFNYTVCVHVFMCSWCLPFLIYNIFSTVTSLCKELLITFVWYRAIQILTQTWNKLRDFQKVNENISLVNVSNVEACLFYSLSKHKFIKQKEINKYLIFLINLSVIDTSSVP